MAERDRAEGRSGEDAAWRELVARFDLPGRPDGTAPPWPAREDLPPARHKQPGPGEASADAAGAATAPADAGTGADRAKDPETADAPGGGDQPAADGAGQPAGTARVIKPAAPAQMPAADQDDVQDDHYIPPPPPPLPSLDPVAKGAWTALFGGPAYLLVATSAGWVLPGWATFGAVAAFVGGFAVLVIRMGDKPSRGSGPDNGAVV